jgi:hypothetical protein
VKYLPAHHRKCTAGGWEDIPLRMDLSSSIMGTQVYGNTEGDSSGRKLPMELETPLVNH